MRWDLRARCWGESAEFERLTMQISPKSKGNIKTIGFILTGLSIFSFGVILYFWLGILKPYTKKLERPRVPLLKKVAAAQAKFRSQDLDKDGISDFANLQELIKFKLLTYREVQKAGFVFVEPAIYNRKKCWWAVAQPLHPNQGRSFFINHTGIIYYSIDTPWNFESRINRKTAEVPTGAQPINEP